MRSLSRQNSVSPNFLQFLGFLKSNAQFTKELTCLKNALPQTCFSQLMKSWHFGDKRFWPESDDDDFISWSFLYVIVCWFLSDPGWHCERGAVCWHSYKAFIAPLRREAMGFQFEGGVCVCVCVSVHVCVCLWSRVRLGMRVWELLFE